MDNKLFNVSIRESSGCSHCIRKMVHSPDLTNKQQEIIKKILILVDKQEDAVMKAFAKAKTQNKEFDEENMYTEQDKEFETKLKEIMGNDYLTMDQCD